MEIGFDIALKRAEELDSYFEQHGKIVGPLHGLPVTLKDQFHIKGLGTSMAFVGWIGTFEGRKGTGKEKAVKSELVRELHDLGAVPIGKVKVHSAVKLSRTDIRHVYRRRWCRVFGLLKQTTTSSAMPGTPTISFYLLADLQEVS